MANPLFIAVLAAALTACGGGGGSNSSSGNASPAAAADSTAPAAITTGSTVTAQPSPPVGTAPSRVNQDSAGAQTLRALGTLGQGGTAIAWLSQTAGGTSVRLQHFDATGGRDGVEVTVALDAGATDVAAAVLPDGGLALAWVQTGAASDTQPWITRTAIMVRRYDALGGALTPARQVAFADYDRTGAAAARYLGAPTVLRWDDGNFLVAWSQIQEDASGKVPQFFEQRFTPAGDPVGIALPIGNGAPGTSLQIAATPNGGFVIATALAVQGRNWLMMRGFDGSKSPVLPQGALGAAEGSLLLPLQGNGMVLFSPTENVAAMQLYDAQGQALGQTAGLRAMPVAATALRDGGYLVLLPAAGGELRAQRFDAAGQPVGPEIAVATAGGVPRGVVLGDGSVELAWTADTGGDQDVMAVRITP
ncbi:MAG: hypothetical protein ACXWC2_09865 [Ramlibacter sp.]